MRAGRGLPQVKRGLEDYGKDSGFCLWEVGALEGCRETRVGPDSVLTGTLWWPLRGGRTGGGAGRAGGLAGGRGTQVQDCGDGADQRDGRPVGKK